MPTLKYANSIHHLLSSLSALVSVSSPLLALSSTPWCSQSSAPDPPTPRQIPSPTLDPRPSAPRPAATHRRPRTRRPPKTPTGALGRSNTSPSSALHLGSWATPGAPARAARESPGPARRWAASRAPCCRACRRAIGRERHSGRNKTARGGGRAG